MKPLIPTLLVALALGSGGTALAKGPGHCPPGLAKKAVPCVPPGQAKKGLRHRGGGKFVGQAPRNRANSQLRRYRDDRPRLRRLRQVPTEVWYNGRRYDRHRGHERLPRLGRGEVYYSNGDVVLRVNPETQRVIELLLLGDLVFGN